MENSKRIKIEILRVLKEKAGENIDLKDIYVIVATRILCRPVKLPEDRKLITELMSGTLAGLIEEGKVRITVAWNVQLDS